jgi:chromosome segregation ATPase
MKLAAFIGAAAVLLADAKLTVRREDPDPERLADSDVIDGPDCGHVKQIIGKWGKAKKAGKLAGEAKGAVMQADKAANIVDKVITRAENIGKEINDGDIPDSVKRPADHAKDKSTEASNKAGELDTMVGAFKNKITEHEFSAKAVASGDMSDLKKKTVEVNDAIKDSYDAAERALSKAQDEKKKALKDAGKALKILKATFDKAEPLIKDSKELAQKSTHAMEDGEDIASKAEGVVSDVRSHADEADDQAPVFRVLADNLEAMKESVTTAKDSLNTAIGEMETAADDLQTHADDLKSAIEHGDAGETEAVQSQATEVPEIEGALDKLSSEITSVKSHAKNLLERIDLLKKDMKNAEKKIA